MVDNKNRNETNPTIIFSTFLSNSNQKIIANKMYSIVVKPIRPYWFIFINFEIMSVRNETKK